MAHTAPTMAERASTRIARRKAARLSISWTIRKTNSVRVQKRSVSVTVALLTPLAIRESVTAVQSSTAQPITGVSRSRRSFTSVSSATETNSSPPTSLTIVSCSVGNFSAPCQGRIAISTSTKTSGRATTRYASARPASTTQGIRGETLVSQAPAAAVASAAR